MRMGSLLQVTWITLMLMACSTSEPKNEIRIAIVSDLTIDHLQVWAENSEGQTDTLSFDAMIRPSDQKPFELVIRSGVLTQHAFRLWFKGSLKQVIQNRGAITLSSVQNRTDATVFLSATHTDLDNDGYWACSIYEPGCDCNDQNEHINPFQTEICSDGIDNNCSGLPVDETCSEDDDANQLCTTLAGDFLSLAGIGKCHFGTFEKQGNTWVCSNSGLPSVEVDNSIDDDCDGSVDEQFPCGDAHVRYCHRGFVDHEPIDEQPQASELALGECSQNGHPYGIQTCLDSGLWSVCENDVLPTRDAVTGLFVEQAPTLEHVWGACDGKDNDCDGYIDEESWFDADGDGYTLCGTCNVAPHYTCIDSIDCQDGDARVHPGQQELCNNGKDDNCLCDHDPEDRAQNTQGSVIGLPVLTSAVAELTCSETDADLNCARVVRNADDATGDCHLYYAGYAGPSATNQDCYFCRQSYGLTCNESTQRCDTQEQTCEACSIDDTYVFDQPAEVRPLCKKPSLAGCYAQVPAVWQDIVGSDPNDECGAVACDAYYAGILNDRCYVRANVSAEAVVCAAGGRCQTASEVCGPRAGISDVFVPHPDICLRPVSGCFTQTAPVFAFQNDGEDVFDECMGEDVCDGTGHCRPPALE